MPGVGNIGRTLTTKEHEGTLWVAENSIILTSVVATSYILSKFIDLYIHKKCEFYVKCISINLKKSILSQKWPTILGRDLHLIELKLLSFD